MPGILSIAISTAKARTSRWKFEYHKPDNYNELMKSKDYKRLSQLTESTSPPVVSFHLDSASQERISHGHKIKNFYKIRVDGLAENRL